MRRWDRGACFKNNEKDDGMRVVLSSAALKLSASAVAEEFDYEVSLGFDNSNTESQFSIPPDLLDIFPFPIATDTESDSDTFNGSFRWYFEGLSDEIGPRDRAVFANRASFAQFAVLSGTLSRSSRQVEGDQVLIIDDDTDLTGYVLSARKVFDNWFFEGSVSGADIESNFSLLEQTAVTAGAGRYFGETTALSLTVIRTSTDFMSNNDIDSGLQIDLNHIGDLFGSQWQYAVDVSANNETFESSDGSYEVGLTLYPTKNFGIGFEIEDQLGGTNNDAIRYTLGANWFVSPQLQFEFAVGTIDIDNGANQDTDTEQYGVQARYRF
ncbi:MAG: autotransporter outer membrane beta-barrel domain-containing protein [Pseudomonadota bacterium]